MDPQVQITGLIKVWQAQTPTPTPTWTNMELKHHTLDSDRDTHLLDRALQPLQVHSRGKRRYVFIFTSTTSYDQVTRNYISFIVHVQGMDHTTDGVDLVPQPSWVSKNHDNIYPLSSKYFTANSSVREGKGGRLTIAFSQPERGGLLSLERLESRILMVKSETRLNLLIPFF